MTHQFWNYFIPNDLLQKQNFWTPWFPDKPFGWTSETQKIIHFQVNHKNQYHWSSKSFSQCSDLFPNELSRQRFLHQNICLYSTIYTNQQLIGTLCGWICNIQFNNSLMKCAWIDYGWVHKNFRNQQLFPWMIAKLFLLLEAKQIQFASFWTWDKPLSVSSWIPTCQTFLYYCKRTKWNGMRRTQNQIKPLYSRILSDHQMIPFQSFGIIQRTKPEFFQEYGNPILERYLYCFDSSGWSISWDPDCKILSIRCITKITSLVIQQLTHWLDHCGLPWKCIIWLHASHLCQWTTFMSHFAEAKRLRPVYLYFMNLRGIFSSEKEIWNDFTCL